MFTRNTVILIKALFVLHVIIIVSSFYSLTLYSRYPFLKESGYYLLTIGVSFGVCLFIYLRRYIASLVLISISALDLLYDAVWGVVYDSNISPYGIILELLSLSFTSILEILIVLVFVRSEEIRDYFRGIPFERYDEKTGRPIIDWTRILPRYLWILIGLLGFSVCIGQIVIGQIDDSLEITDIKGFKNQGQAMISVFQNKTGEITFAWKGRSVSRIEVFEGRLEDTDKNPPAWAVTALINRNNCLSSPIKYGEINNKCATSMVPEKLPKGNVYTVRILRSYNVDTGVIYAREQSAREFMVN